MGKNWLPQAEADLASFCSNVATRITSTPSAYNVVAGDATALSALVADFVTKRTAANEPTTRTPVVIASKDVAKAALIAEMRLLYKKFNAGNLAADKRQELGLPIIDKEPTVIPAPASKPVCQVIVSDSISHTIRVKDENTLESKRKPEGVEGYELFYSVQPVGTPPPADLREWASAGIGKKSDFTLAYRPEDAGKVAHVRAIWFNPRGQRGAAGDVITAPIAA
jgi:hypothetical protein